MTRPHRLFALTGPTAIGKTNAGVLLAKALKTDVLSFDSRQFYRELSIGTAKPTAAEIGTVKHHFIGHISITDNYSAGAFERQALAFLADFFPSNNRIVAVGGSGMYLDALVNGFDELPHDMTIRNQLILQFKTEGIEPLQDELRQRDPSFFHTVDPNNPQRLIRALEVCRISGKPYSSLRQNAKARRDFETTWIGLTAPRDELYDRINARVDLMVENGLIEEARSVYPQRHLNALNTVGYKELFEHFNGNATLDEAIATIKKNTRNFAKRQYTWFKKNKDIRWFDYREVEPMIAFAVEQSQAT